MAVPLLIAALGVGTPSPESVGFYDGRESRIEDPEGDAVPVLHSSNPSLVPEAKRYHDVVSASVRKVDGIFLFTIELAGNPNLNEKYETNYMWHLLAPDPSIGTERHHVLMLFNFAPDFNHTSQGWYYAIFDRTANAYIIPQTAIPDMPADRVEYSIEQSLIGAPPSFTYWISVYSRVNVTSFAGPPEYLMDHAP